ncbi:MAG: glutathione S-transferase family protein [Pseudomonadota bacterium]
MSLQILGFPRSNFVRTVRMSLHEKGVDYELVEEFPHSDAVKAVHPLGLIPAMRHGDLEIGEAVAIIRYVDKVFDGAPLFPDDPAACARIDYWCSLVATSVDQLFMRNYVVPYAFHRDDDGNVVRTKIDPAVKRMPKVLGILNDAVGDGHLAGADFTVADCFLMPMLAAIQMFPEGQEAVPAHSDLNAYFKRLSERESFVATAPPAR